MLSPGWIHGFLDTFTEMELAEIEQRTRESLPQWAAAELVLSLIEKGGSGRVFVRVREISSDRSIIAMHWGLDRSDNPRFASITDFLLRHDIPAPAILARREDLNMLWVQDLGEIDLGHLADRDWTSVRRPAYEAALRSVFALHSIRESEAPDDLPELERPFDVSLYQWEQGYFLTHYVERFHSAAVAEELTADSALAAVCEELATLPRALVHRDFQSTNVMLLDGNAWLIDYQGLRWGLPEYDLASLVYDPYSAFTPEETEDLICYYFELKQQAGCTESTEKYRRRLVQCAIQRLMQALGAYGFLGEVKGKREFLAHIPRAKERLLALAGQEGGIPALVELLE